MRVAKLAINQGMEVSALILGFVVEEIVGISFYLIYYILCSQI